MSRVKRVSFLVKKQIEKRVSFVSSGKKVSFIAKVPSQRRERITFYVKKERR